MSAPWFPFFTADWIVGVTSLSAAERGVYVSLIARIYDSECPIKHDDARLARECGLPVHNFRRALAALVETGKLTLVDGMIFNERAKTELTERKNRSLTATQSANSRWEKHKINQREYNANALPTQCETDATRARGLQSHSQIEEDRSSLRSDPSAEGADLFPAEKIDRAKAKADARRIELKSFGEAWNDIAADHRLPEIDSIDPGSTRERQALATLKWLRDHDSEPQAFFAKIRAGPYLLGEVNGFRASFDWVCKAANRQKIMDGNYENREKAKSFVDQFRAPHIAR